MDELRSAMRGLGYRTSSAATGPEGLEMACTEESDLILLDVMLPGLDGYALCRELRQRGRRTPVLMLTAKGLVDDRVEGLESGADDYLVKPFSMKELTPREGSATPRRAYGYRPGNSDTGGNGV